MNFGIIGTNFISREFVAAGTKVENFHLKAVYSRKEETARSFIEAVLPSGADEVSVFTSLMDLAENDSVDAIYVASPNLFHFEQVRLMLEHGKHVFVEKPAMICAEQFQELKELADAKGLVLMEGMRTIFTPGFTAVKNALGEIGKIRRASLSYCQYSRRYDNYKNGIVENAFNPKLGNGAIMDIGVYLIASLTALLGRPDDVTAKVMKLDNGLDYQGLVVGSYDEGILADLSYGKVSDSVRWNEIEGEQGTVVYFPPTNPKKVVLKLRGKDPETIFSDENNEFYGMCHEINAFIKFAAKSDNGISSLSDVQSITLNTLSVIDKIRRETGIDFQ